MTPSLRVRSRTSGFLLGASYVWRGFRAWGVNGRLMLLGLIPGAIVFCFAAVALIVLVSRLGELARALVAAFGVDGVGAEGGGLLVNVLVWLVGAALLGGSVLIVFYTFTALTLVVGQPFFERISLQVDAALGAPAPLPEPPWWRSLLRSLGEAARLLLLTMAIAIGLFVLSLVPVVGPVASFMCGAIFGGWFLTLELTSFALTRRGVVTLRQRRHALATQRAVAVGFGTTVFLLFLIPLGAVATMPAATAGATLLTRRLTGESDYASGLPVVTAQGAT